MTRCAPLIDEDTGAQVGYVLRSATHRRHFLIATRTPDAIAIFDELLKLPELRTIRAHLYLISVGHLDQINCIAPFSRFLPEDAAFDQQLMLYVDRHLEPIARMHRALTEMKGFLNLK
ncbi:hypothetical protein AL073_14940 [Loktanella sp. 1ANDIMAR09]|nr:hypothetical protein AL073_14940 [Loktanella sp. 1ANDIMAR09]